MTTLYRPVPITSAEQAEALPVGTLAISSEDYDDGTVMHWAAVKVSNEWARTDIANGLPFLRDAAMVDADLPWTALVPIEAEEETQGITTWPRPDNAPWPEHSDLCSNSGGEHYYRDEDGVAHDITEEMTAWLAAQPVRTRYVTPWEEA